MTINENWRGPYIRVRRLTNSNTNGTYASWLSVQKVANPTLVSCLKCLIYIWILFVTFLQSTNHLINNWSVFKSQWSLPHYQGAKCYFNLASGSYHYQGFVFSVFFSCYEAVIYHIDPVSYQSIIFTHTSSLALNYHWCPPLHAVCVQHFIYPRETFYPVNTYFYITRGLQETVQLCGHSTLENCWTSKVFVSITWLHLSE